MLNRFFEKHTNYFAAGASALVIETNVFTYNCDLFVFGPEFAILSIPLPVWDRFGLKSSGNEVFQYDSPPSPVPVGSPPCTCIFKHFDTYCATIKLSFTAMV